MLCPVVRVHFSRLALAPDPQLFHHFHTSFLARIGTHDEKNEQIGGEETLQSCIKLLYCKYQSSFRFSYYSSAD